VLLGHPKKFGRGKLKLHVPKSGDYRKHIYEAEALCRRKGWIALDKHQVTCVHCLRKVDNGQDLGLLDVIEHMG
jgi:hypothetical protein